MLTLGLCLAVVIAPIAGDRALAASARTSLPSPLTGITIAGGSDATAIAGRIADASALHAKVVRTEVSWSLFEPEAPNLIDPATLASLDTLVGDAAAHGIRVILLVDSTPCWASSAPAPILSKCMPGNAGEAGAWPPSNANTYGAFVAFLAGRYGNRLAAIEVWNEPDQANEAYLAGPNKAQHYAAILRAAYPAIKGADPNTPVLAGSIVGANGAFLRALYKAGIKGYYNGLSVHFYNLTLAGLRYTHEVQLAHGDSTPLWLNEFGWSSCWPDRSLEQEQACVTPQTQAANMANMYRSLARTPWIAAAITYKLLSAQSEDFGVLTESGVRKPSFAALRGVFVSPFGKPSPVTIRLSPRGGRVVASGSGPVGDYMELEAFRGGRAIYRTLFTLNRFNHYTLSLPRQLGTTKLSVKVFQFWMGAAKAGYASV
jgi:Cellulase (glycosyl hydrolase family 5)